MRILFLSRWFPYPVENGSKIRIFNMLNSLAADHQVALVSFATEDVAPSSLALMRTICDEVHVVAYQCFRPNSVQARLGFFSATPRSVLGTFSEEMRAAARQVAARWQPDLVIASQIDMAPYALAVQSTPRVLEELEVAVPYDAAHNQASPAAQLRKKLTWWKLSRYLRRILPAFDLCTVVSARERNLVRSIAPVGLPIHVVPNGVDGGALHSVATTPDPHTLIYSGALSFYANYDAMAYFLSDIFPLILARAPESRLLITGSTEGVPIDRLPRCPNVHFTGYLDDIWSAVAGSWVSVAPIRLGGGTRLKIIESLALGTPVVATPKGAEGLDLKAGVDLSVAADAQSFAEQTLALLQDPALRHGFAQRGQHAVRQYDWRLIGQQLNGLLADVLARQNAPQQASRGRI